MRQPVARKSEHCYDVGQLTRGQIAQVGWGGADTIGPICDAGERPDDDQALATLNEQVRLLEDIIRRASGG